MEKEELVKLVADVVALKCEQQNIELKKSAAGTPKHLYDTLSSFSNQKGGGVIIFGVDEADNFSVCGVHDAQILQKEVTEQALQMEPPVRLVFTAAEINGKTVVSAEIGECDNFEKPCYYKGKGKLRGSYVRVGDADVPMTEYEVYSYEAFKRNIHDELRIVERADFSSFSRNALNEYFAKIKDAKPRLALQSEEKILELQGATQNGKPTLAGILLFGEYPQAFFPQLSITAMCIDRNEFYEISPNTRFIDNKRIEGNLQEMLEDSISFVRRNMKTATIITKDGKRDDKDEYPVIALREIILNALIHRDYSIHTQGTPIRIIIYKNRIEVENPGGLYGRLTIDELGKTAGDTRNPFIAGALEVLKVTENRFSGIPTIRNEMKNAGLQEPVFESLHGTFKVMLYNSTQARSSLPLDKAGSTIVKEETLLDFCKTPRSREEITEFVGVKTAFYAVRHFVAPLLQKGLLKMTLPEKPKSKRQKYYSE